MRRAIAICLAGLIAGNACAVDAAAGEKALRAFLDAHCVECHGTKAPEGNVSLAGLTFPRKGAADLNLWGRVFEQIESRQMPPVDATQPSLADRLAMVRALRDSLQAAGEYIDEVKSLAPSRGNWVDHESLFSGAAAGESGTPARAWRLSAEGYMRLFNRLDEAFGLRLTAVTGLPAGGQQGPTLPEQSIVSAPWGSPRQWQFTDYSAVHRVSGPEIEHHLRNCTLMAQAMLAEIKKSKGPLPQMTALMGAGKMATPEQVQAAVEALFEMLFHLRLDPASLQARVDQTKKDLDEAGAEVAIERLLVSALCHVEAIYRTEEPEQAVRRGVMAPRHVARAISFTLTAREPDAELWKAVDEGRLATAADVRAQIERILDDAAIPKPRLLGFFREYFGYPGAEDIFKDDATMTEFGVPAVHGSYFHGIHLVADTDKLVHKVLAADRAVLRTLLTTRTSYICARDADAHRADLVAVARMKEKDRAEAAKKGQPFDENDKRYIRRLEAPNRGDLFAQMQIMYGVMPRQDWEKKYGKSHVSPEPIGPDISAEKFVETLGEFEANPERRMGILTQPSWLVAMSSNLDNHPIHRGRWIRERLLGGHVPEVPITVNAMLPHEPHHAMRKRMRVTREEYCWKCHQLMDPLGLAFEQYDHFGRYRTREIVVDEQKDAELRARDPVRKHRAMTAVDQDTTGGIIGSGDPRLDGPVAGPLELIEKLANSEHVEQVFVRHVFRYFLGRNETLADGPLLVAAHRAYRDGGGSMRALVASLLSSDASLIRIRDPEAANPESRSP